MTNRRMQEGRGRADPSMAVLHHTPNGGRRKVLLARSIVARLGGFRGTDHGEFRRCSARVHGGTPQKPLKCRMKAYRSRFLWLGEAGIVSSSKGF